MSRFSRIQVPATLAIALSVLACGFGSGNSEKHAASGPGEEQLLQLAAPPKQPSARGSTFQLRTRLELRLDTGSKPVGVLGRDLDGDGKSEWIGLAREPGQLSIHGGISNAAVPAPRSASMAISDWPIGPAWIESGPQLAFATRAPSELWIVDAARFWSTQAPESVLFRTALPQRPRVLASGRLGDAAQLGIISVEDVLFLYDSRGQQRKAQPLADTHACALAFLPDGQGFLVGFQGTRRVMLYAPTAAGEFGYAPSTTLELPGLPRDMEFVDLDADGDLELAIALGDRSLHIYGLGDRQAWSTSLTRAPLAIELALVPIALEAARTSQGTELVALSLAGQEYARFAWRDARVQCLQRGYAGQFPYALAHGDFNGDGQVDWVSANTSAERFGLWFADERGLWTEAERVPTGRSPHSIACGDLDQDQVPDVTLIHALEATLASWVQRNGEWLPANTPIRAAGADRVRLMDVDLDGARDALWLGREGPQAQLHVAFNTGKGSLFERASMEPLTLERGGSDLAVLDELGLVLVADAEGKLLQRLERTAGGLKLAQRFELDCSARSLALWSSPQGLRVALGSIDKRVMLFALEPVAGGSYELRKLQELAALGSIRDLALADLDADGDLDLACLCIEEGTNQVGQVQLALQSESAWAWHPRSYETGARPYAIAAGDLNADGRAELLVSAQNSHHVNLFVAPSTGGLNYQRAPDLGVGTGPLDLELCDLDGDGCPELLCTNAFSDDLSVIRFR